MMKNLIRHLDPRRTPQSAPIPGSTQVKNSAGGYSFELDPWGRLDRFLVLGSDGGSYYASERALTLENAAVVQRCLELDGLRTVARIVEISVEGRAPKNDPAILALAIALKRGDLATRRAAREAVPRVCRIGTHLFALAGAVGVLGGWGRNTQGAFADWYDRDPGELAYQAIKYQGRHGWTGRDLLRKAHVKPRTDTHDALFGWMVGGWDAVPAEAPPAPMDRVWAFEQAKRADQAAQIVDLVERYRLPRECIPTRWLNDRSVWEALLASGMPLGALIRNLGKLSALGLTELGADSLGPILERLAHREALRKARVHPLTLLNALVTYRSGRGLRGKNVWKVSRPVVDALDAAFYTSFDFIEPTGKRWMLALDVSGSMAGGRLAGLAALSPREGTAAMAMVTARTESLWQSFAFCDRFVPLEIGPTLSLDEIVRRTSGLPFGGTDCALPMVHARKCGLKVDVFVVYTDSETWFGNVHPVQALRAYRQATGIPAKLIVVGMVANRFSIADPEDAGMLDVVGFDAAAPALMSQFAQS